MRARPRILVGATLCALAVHLPATAEAAVRWAEPGGSTTSGTCPQADPCDLQRAVEVVAQPNDEVVVTPGTYPLGANQLAVSDAGLQVHGQVGQPLPKITSTSPLDGVFTSEPATLRDLEIDYGGSSNAISLVVVGGGEALGERLIVNATGGAAACHLGNAAIRDSVCRATSPGTDALATPSGVDLDVTATNVTAVARTFTGAGSYGLYVNAAGTSSVVLQGKNVIASGVDGDVRVETSAPGATAAALLVNSNFATASTNGGPGTGTAPIPGANDNQTAEPLFAGFATGDFHQVTGSPTINAGTGGPGLGTLDFDRQARVQGPAPDIGADEFPQASGALDDDPPETEITKGPRKKTKKRRARFEFASDEPGASFECKLDGGDFEPCDASEDFRVKRKRHRLQARAVDKAGNRDPTPAEHRWKVKRKRKRG
jgi:hypothetical protein